MPATIELARAGGTVGEWADALRDVFGEYRAPTGVGGDRGQRRRRHARGARRHVQEEARDARRPAADPRRQARPRRPLERRRADRGRGPRRGHGGRVPGDPAHARRRSRPRRATRTSTSSGSRSSRARTSSSCPRRSGCSRELDVDAPVVVGGIIPEADQVLLRAAGVARIYTPKDYRFAADHGGSRRARHWNIGGTAQSTPPRRIGEPMDSP